MNLNATLLGQMGTFGLFVWFTMKYIWPPVVKAMQDRQKRIADGLAAAERGVHSLELSKQESIQILRKAKEEASCVVDQATLRSTKLIEEAKDKGRKESNRLVTQGKAEIDQEFEKAKIALRQETADIVIESVSKVFEAKLDKKTHEKMLNELINQI